MTDKVEYLNPPGAFPPKGLYSHVGKANDGQLLFVAGQLSIAGDGSVVGIGDFAAQFHQVFSNLGDVINGLGGDFNDIVKFNIFLVDSQDIEKFSALRAALFPRLFKGPSYPPSTLLVVSGLVKKEFMIEVEAIVRGPSR